MNDNNVLFFIISHKFHDRKERKKWLRRAFKYARKHGYQDAIEHYMKILK